MFGCGLLLGAIFAAFLGFVHGSQRANGLCLLSVDKWADVESLRVDIRRTEVKHNEYVPLEQVVFEGRTHYKMFAQSLVVNRGDELLFLASAGATKSNQVSFQTSYKVAYADELAIESPSHVDIVDTVEMLPVGGKQVNYVSYKMIIMLTQVHTPPFWHYIVKSSLFPRIVEDPEAAALGEFEFKQKMQIAFEKGWKSFRRAEKYSRWILVFVDNLKSSMRLSIFVGNKEISQSVDQQSMAAFFPVFVRTADMPFKIRFGAGQNYKEVEINPKKYFYRADEFDPPQNDNGNFHMVVFKKFREYNYYWRRVESAREEATRKTPHFYWNDKELSWNPGALEQLVQEAQKKGEENTRKAVKAGEFYSSESGEDDGFVVLVKKNSNVVLIIIIILIVLAAIGGYLWWKYKRNQGDASSSSDKSGNENELTNAATNKDDDRSRSRESAGDDETESRKIFYNSNESSFEDAPDLYLGQVVPDIKFSKMFQLEEALFGHSDVIDSKSERNVPSENADDHHSSITTAMGST